MLALALCFLGSAVLFQCDYVPLAERIPPSHLALIRCVEPSPGHGWAQPGGCIGLPWRAGLHVLSHEVGHLVAWTDGNRSAFAVEFWPGGVRWGSGPSSYARTNVDEDFAESMAHVVMRDTADMPERRDWLLRRFPELGP